MNDKWIDYTAAAIPYQAQHTTCSEVRLRNTAGPLHDFLGYSTASRKRLTIWDNRVLHCYMKTTECAVIWLCPDFRSSNVNPL